MSKPLGVVWAQAKRKIVAYFARPQEEHTTRFRSLSTHSFGIFSLSAGNTTRIFRKEKRPPKLSNIPELAMRRIRPESINHRTRWLFIMCSELY